jgi:hypothetical protein
MSDPPRIGIVWARVLVAAAAGPATALLHEFDVLSLGPAASLWPLLVIVLAAVLGIVLGLRIGRQGLRRLRWLAMIPNGLILCLYSFFMLFFGLGGSR